MNVGARVMSRSGESFATVARVTLARGPCCPTATHWLCYRLVAAMPGSARCPNCLTHRPRDTREQPTVICERNRLKYVVMLHRCCYATRAAAQARGGPQQHSQPSARMAALLVGLDNVVLLGVPLQQQMFGRQAAKGEHVRQPEHQQRALGSRS
jgi:hypothetical protein